MHTHSCALRRRHAAAASDSDGFGAGTSSLGLSSASAPPPASGCFSLRAVPRKALAYGHGYLSHISISNYEREGVKSAAAESMAATKSRAATKSLAATKSTLWQVAARQIGLHQADIRSEGYPPSFVFKQKNTEGPRRARGDGAAVTL